MGQPSPIALREAPKQVVKAQSHNKEKHVQMEE